MLKKLNAEFKFSDKTNIVKRVVTGENIDRSLNSEFLKEYFIDRKMNYKVPDWDLMIEEMKSDIDRWE